MLYQFTYNSKLPQNLCPYFWKLVLALVLFIPYLIIKLPSYIENLFAKDYRETYEHLGCGLALYFTGLCLFIIGLVEYQWIKVIFHCYSYECELANCGAIVFFVCLMILILFFIIQNQMDKRYDAKFNIDNVIKVEKQPNIIIAFIKAKYNKYCPILDWE